MSKDLTIIIPTYNDTYDKVKCSLDSIAMQCEYDLSAIEVIIVDDCSNKNKVDWNKVLEMYPSLNIRYTKLLENKGPGVARQVALDMASGDFVFFLDCGDCLFDNSVLNTFDKYKDLDGDIIATKMYDTDSGNKRRSFLFNNAYVFGIFIKKQFLDANNIRYSEVLRWEEDAYFEELLRYYSPKVVYTHIVGYTYNNDQDSITRQNDHEYQNNFGGFSAMVVKSMLLCDFYNSQNDYESLISATIQILSLCYARFYSNIYQENNISERQSNILYLLKILLEKYSLKTDSEDFRKLFVKDLFRRNTIYKYYGTSEVPYDKIDEFLAFIRDFENLNGVYHIEGTNITVEELLSKGNTYSSGIKKH